MSDEFIIEQSAELNKYLYAPRSWPSRLRLCSFWFPIGFGLSLLGVGSAWLDNELQQVNWLVVVLLCVAFPVGGVLVYELNGRTRLKSEKKLQLNPHGVKISAFTEIPWSDICRFTFVKLTPNPPLVRLALDYKTTLNRRKIETSCYLVLEEEQTAALQRAVGQFGHPDKIQAEPETTNPRIGEVPDEYSWVMWCVMTAFLQFPIGLGFLAAATLTESFSGSPKNDKPLPHEHLIRHFLFRVLHLRTHAMLNLFFGLLGAALLIASGILVYISWTTLNRMHKTRRYAT